MKKMRTPELLERYHNEDKLFKYEEKYLKKKLMMKADEVFAKWIRDRDKAKDCVSYWAANCKNIIQNNCHRLWRERFSHRWDEDNCAWGCASCNGYNKQEHQQLFTVRQIKMFWEDWVAEQFRERHKNKPTIEEMEEVINRYK